MIISSSLGDKHGGSATRRQQSLGYKKLKHTQSFWLSEEIKSLVLFDALLVARLLLVALLKTLAVSLYGDNAGLKQTVRCALIATLLQFCCPVFQHRRQCLLEREQRLPASVATDFGRATEDDLFIGRAH
jgi:hypothetical protein